MNKSNIIIKVDFPGEQTVGDITKIVGLVEARFLIPVIDGLDLDANPRSSKTGPVTDGIQESIMDDYMVFPFKTKGILLASSYYERLERNRFKIIPDDPKIEGILDGGHNTLAIGLYVLSKAFEREDKVLPKGAKTWDKFKELWHDNRETVVNYLEFLKGNSDIDDLKFYIPVELLVPRDTEDIACVESFKNKLLEICEARNNNVQLPVSDKANQKGYFDTLKELMEDYDSNVCRRIEWKTNDGGDIKAQDIVALSWIPLSLIDPVKDEHGRVIEPVAPNKLYSAKGTCLKQFEKLMSSPEVTELIGEDYRCDLINREVESAFKIAVQLPEIYDYIYEMFPVLYNVAGGIYGRINAVKTLNDKRKDKCTPFMGRKIETLSPDGFIMPLFYGLKALMRKKTVGDHEEIGWSQPPMTFLHANLGKIVEYYAGIFSMCDYDPQKVGKNPQSYMQALAGFKMAVADIL